MSKATHHSHQLKGQSTQKKPLVSLKQDKQKPKQLPLATKPANSSNTANSLPAQPSHKQQRANKYKALQQAQLALKATGKTQQAKPAKQKEQPMPVYAVKKPLQAQKKGAVV